jgi:hypothetical protein
MMLIKQEKLKRLLGGEVTVLADCERELLDGREPTHSVYVNYWLLYVYLL